MAQKISIAFETAPGMMTREERETGMKLLRDLQIDRAFRLICPDGTIRDAFLNILARPLPVMAETVRRQEAIRLFHTHPVLLDRLIELIRRLIMSKNSWDAERSRLYASRRVNPNDPGQMLANSKQTLILACHFLRIEIHILHEMMDAIDHFAANTGYIGRLREACAMASSGESMDELTEFADRCEKNLANAFSFDVDFSVDSELMCGSFMLSDFQYIRQAPQKKSKQGLFSLLMTKENDKKAPAADPEKKKAAEEAGIRFHMNNTSVEYGIDFAAKAVAECDRYISAMTRGLYERFSDIEPELYFYKACVMHIERMEERGVGYVYPVIRDYEENTLKCRNLSDLLLLTESMNVQSVVPNDVDIGVSEETTGMLIMGKNNSGKTVYLRSVGTAVTLAQCGLPIPAEKAEISLRRRIFTHFARAEGELTPLSQAGRFEEETAELAGIIGKIEPCSLLMMNETFQTTSYDEGSEGMYYILKYISKLGCGFIFVTHLTKLVEMCRGNAMLAKTSDDPRTRYKLNLIDEYR